ncbi:hypothetical protein L1887_58369 [Cichorium endivia]|nr:hypothetical protein L1887_58369 [Cichorium endivia]
MAIRASQRDGGLKVAHGCWLLAAGGSLVERFAWRAVFADGIGSRERVPRGAACSSSSSQLALKPLGNWSQKSNFHAVGGQGVMIPYSALRQR